MILLIDVTSDNIPRVFIKSYLLCNHSAGEILRKSTCAFLLCVLCVLHSLFCEESEM